MRVIRVIHDYGAPQAITILSGQVAMVPERAGLIGSRKCIREGVVGGDGALVDERGAICPVGAGLEQSVPMLRGDKLMSIQCVR